MIKLILLLVISIVIAFFVKLRTEEILPLVFMAAMLSSYIFGIAGRLDYAVAGSLAAALFVIAALFFTAVYRKTDFQKKWRQSVPLLFTPQILVCLLVCMASCWIFSAHRITHWDDLSYWAIYAKNLFSIDRLPAGIENCTVSYKDYMPLMQIADYFFMYGRKVFDEALLFQVNVCFMYILLLPLLKNLTKCRTAEKIGMIVFYIIFPHIFTTQFYHKLGVDYLLSILFGYCLYAVLDKDQGKLFYNIRLITACSFLVLLKSSGIVLAAAVIILSLLFSCEENFAGAHEKVRRYRFVKNHFLFAAIPVLFYVSWKIFSKVTGNSGYLSDRVESNIRLFKHAFPAYTGDVLQNYIRHFFSFALTRQKIGVTAFGLLLFVTGVYFVWKHYGKADRKEQRFFLALCVGFFLFCAAHIYMYLFVFDEWEAEGLLEFDRYICQYLAGMFYLSVYKVWDIGEHIRRERLLRVNPVWIFLCIFLSLLPFRTMKLYLTPERFGAFYAKGWDQTANAAREEWENSGINELDLPHDEEHKLMLIANAWEDELQYFIYYAVPQPVAFVANVPAIDAGKLKSFAETQMEQNNIACTYVLRNAASSYQGDYQAESAALTTDGKPLEGGKIYVSEKSEPWKLHLYKKDTDRGEREKHE